MTGLDSALGLAGRAGSPRLRNLAAGLDLMRSTGPRYLRRRWREQAALAGLSEALAASLYRRIWTDAAQELGVQLRPLTGEFLELRGPRAATRVWYHWVALDDAVSLQLALDKPYVQSALSAIGLSVPDHVEIGHRDIEAAIDFMETAGGPLVVKPASGTSGGDGVTSGVGTRSELVRACLRASRGDPRLLVERRVEGEMYRLLFMEGELLDVVRRRPPTVTGDGSSTIAGLIAAENRRRLAGGGQEGLVLLLADLDCVLALARQGLGLSSRPESGARVAVKSVVSQNAPRDNETVHEPVSDDLVAEAAAAADAIGLRLCGVDLITSDTSRPLTETGGAILEANGTPGLHYHYLVADRDRARRVAIPVLSRLLDGERAAPVGSRAQAAVPSVRD